MDSNSSWFEHFVAWISAALGVAVWYKLTLDYAPFGSDFTQDYLAGWALDHGHSIYGKSIIELGESVAHVAGIENFHPPFNALLYWPISFLSYPNACWVWSGLNFFAYTALLLVILRRFGLSEKRYACLTPLFYLWPPFIFSIGQGVVSVWLSLLMVCGVFMLETKKERLAGVLFGAATLIKLFPGYFFLVFLALRRWRAALYLAATVGVGFIFTLLIVGHEDFLLYIKYVIKADTEQWVHFPMNISSWSVWTVILKDAPYTVPLVDLPVLARYLPYTTCVLLAYINLRDVFINGEHCKGDLLRIYLISASAMVLISPISWEHILIAFLPLLGVRFSETDRLNNKQLAAISLCLVLISLPSFYFMQRLAELYAIGGVPWYLSLAAKTGLWGLLVLFALILLLRRRANKC